MHILALQAYDGGSHKQFLDGLIAHSRHRFSRINLPARKWKWRMRGAAIYFTQCLNSNDCDIDLNSVDLILTSDMTSTADLRALLPTPLKHKPVVCYFHENQLTYPLPDESDRDYQYGFTNITSCLTADAVWFNSNYHLNSFFASVERLLGKMPDYVPTGIVEQIEAKSQVIPPGLPDDVFSITPPDKPSAPPTLLWNHRWEYDKNPDEFFEILFDLDRAEIDFRLIVAGETFRQVPPIFDAARIRLKDKIVHFGYAEDRTTYLQLLAQADIVVSTSIHEFFGLAVMEAVAAGCIPILPNRLSYPELIPRELHAEHLYESKSELRQKLIQVCRKLPPLPKSLTKEVEQFNWSHLITQYDSAFTEVANRIASKK